MIMSGNTEALDIMESKIRDLEIRVHGENKPPPTENFTPLSDALIHMDTLLTAVQRGMERLRSRFERLNDLQELFDFSQYNNPEFMATKVDIISKELVDSKTALEEFGQLNGVLYKFPISEILRKELFTLPDASTSRKEKLNDINEELVDYLIRAIDIFVDVLKRFELLNDEITNLEKENEFQKMREE